VTGARFSALSEPSRAVLAQVRRAIVEAKAAGRWANEPVVDTDRFDGPIGSDNHGTITTYQTLDELHLAAVTRALRSRLPGLGAG
jgi:hypothetical protein